MRGWGGDIRELRWCIVKHTGTECRRCGLDSRSRHNKVYNLSVRKVGTPATEGMINYG